MYIASAVRRVRKQAQRLVGQPLVHVGLSCIREQAQVLHHAEQPPVGVEVILVVRAQPCGETFAQGKQLHAKHVTKAGRIDAHLCGGEPLEFGIVPYEKPGDGQRQKLLELLDVI